MRPVGAGSRPSVALPTQGIPQMLRCTTMVDEATAEARTTRRWYRMYCALAPKTGGGDRPLP
ncbi:MAG: hypothetical protein FJ197_00645 [Gammaproteobacteria bacterium]|nr:hypothetical protein [Gammaproteobacteria bacterium]